MILCSNCTRAYPFTRFLLVGNPFRLRCPHCKVDLRGGPATRRICFGALLAILAVAAFGIFGVRVWDWPSRTDNRVVLAGAVVIGTITGVLVWKRGDFRHETQNIDRFCR